jgi:single-strand DNA-binding protein
MSSLNQVNLIGRLGQDPEVKYLPDGSAVANISLATSEQWKDKTSGEKKELTEWHRVVIYGKQAEFAGEYLAKGCMIYVLGSNRTRKWQDATGADRYVTEVRCRELKILIGKPQDSAPAQSGPRNPAASKPSSSKPLTGTQQPPMDFDDDIPF